MLKKMLVVRARIVPGVSVLQNQPVADNFGRLSVVRSRPFVITTNRLSLIIMLLLRTSYGHYAEGTGSVLKMANMEVL